MSEDDLLGNVKFVKLVAVIDLGYAELIQRLLGAEGIGAVIINDEAFQHRSPAERARAEAGPGGFRLEVPQQALPRARKLLEEVRRREESIG
jgi:hypothetical protein